MRSIHFLKCVCIFFLFKFRTLRKCDQVNIPCYSYIVKQFYFQPKIYSHLFKCQAYKSLILYVLIKMSLHNYLLKIIFIYETFFTFLLTFIYLIKFIVEITYMNRREFYLTFLFIFSFC